MTTAREMRAALERIALELEWHQDPAHIAHIIKFARDMAGEGRPGFRAFLQDSAKWHDSDRQDIA
jgi:hypothetical protein